MPRKATKRQEPMPKAKATPVERYKVVDKQPEGHAFQIALNAIKTAREVCNDIQDITKRLSNRQATLMVGPERDKIGRIAQAINEKRNALLLRVHAMEKMDLPAAHDLEYIINTTKDVETMVDMLNFDWNGRKAELTGSKVIER